MFEWIERIFAKKWIAGPTIDDAIKVVKMLNKKNVGVILNYLGEELKEENEINASVENYFEIIDEISEKRLISDIAVKPTQIGLSISYEKARENYLKILRYAKVNDVFVWLDMEASNYVEPTIKLYFEGLLVSREGIAIQSYLKRSNKDVEDIVKRNGIIRLVKGAYKESPEIAYTTWKEKTENYRRIMHYLFENAAEFTVATHDLKLVKEAVELNKHYNKNVTIAMLLGIKNKFLFNLNANNIKKALYVPYGEKWVDYARRRFREASNIILVLRSLFEF
ncbi:MAG: proline dehydrogenase family protein [Nitrososphaeria archaeon]